MPDLVRIRDTKNNTEVTVGRRRAEQLADRGGVQILDTDATDRLGRALPTGDATTAKAIKTSKEPTR